MKNGQTFELFPYRCNYKTIPDLAPLGSPSGYTLLIAAGPGLKIRGTGGGGLQKNRCLPCIKIEATAANWGKGAQLAQKSTIELTP